MTQYADCDKIWSTVFFRIRYAVSICGDTLISAENVYALRDALFPLKLKNLRASECASKSNI